MFTEGQMRDSFYFDRKFAPEIINSPQAKEDCLSLEHINCTRWTELIKNPQARLLRAQRYTCFWPTLIDLSLIWNLSHFKSPQGKDRLIAKLALSSLSMLRLVSVSLEYFEYPQWIQQKAEKTDLYLLKPLLFTGLGYYGYSLGHSWKKGPLALALFVYSFYQSWTTPALIEQPTGREAKGAIPTILNLAKEYKKAGKSEKQELLGRYIRPIHGQIPQDLWRALLYAKPPTVES